VRDFAASPRYVVLRGARPWDRQNSRGWDGSHHRGHSALTTVPPGMGHWLVWDMPELVVSPVFG
jgi:hypothetical protein